VTETALGARRLVRVGDEVVRHTVWRSCKHRPPNGTSPRERCAIVQLGSPTAACALRRVLGHLDDGRHRAAVAASAAPSRDSSELEAGGRS